MHGAIDQNKAARVRFDDAACCFNTSPQHYKPLSFDWYSFALTSQMAFGSLTSGVDENVVTALSLIRGRPREHVRRSLEEEMLNGRLRSYLDARLVSPAH